MDTELNKMEIENNNAKEVMIRVSDVKKSFGKNEAKTQVLNGVSFEIQKGEFVSLMGASGSGKSTLLYLIGGLDREFEGNIEICGESITSLKEKNLSKLRLQKLGFIFQFYNLVQNLSVEDNILLPLSVGGVKPENCKKELDEILEITGLSAKRKSKPGQLSGGQQQRVAVARAVMMNPEILLADEATGNLDSASSKEMMDLFKRINEEKKITILQVTHSETCAQYGNRIIRLENGRVVE